MEVKRIQEEYEQKMKNENEQYQQDFEESTKKFNDDWKRIESLIHVDKKQPYDLKEIVQLQSWTQKQVAEIVYDTDKDGYPQNRSTIFGEKIMNRNDLLFIIEDNDGNKFGEYLHAKVTGWNKWVNDDKAFIFSLKSNGRLDGIKKFEIKNSQNVFKLWNDCYSNLFYIGNVDIGIYKSDQKSSSYTNSTSSFDYHGLSNPLRGTSATFTPKKIVVIQLTDNK